MKQILPLPLAISLVFRGILQNKQQQVKPVSNTLYSNSLRNASVHALFIIYIQSIYQKYQIHWEKAILMGLMWINEPGV